MEFLAKCLFFSTLIAVAFGRYVWRERSIIDSSEDANCSCDWRYFKHYKTKGCVVETEDSCGCPQKFSCPSNKTQQAPAKVCIYQNKEYRVGSKIITPDTCHVCRCQDGVPPQVSCVVKECPQILTALGKNCHLVYKENKCCPKGLECLGDEYEDSAEILRNKTCEYNGQLFPFGSKIYPQDDPCQICICDENWNGADNSSCYEQNCVFEKNKSKLEAGCIPVYHESLCCPIEFYCPSNHNASYSELSSNKSLENYNTSYDDYCKFDGQFYKMEEELSIGNSCVKCTCTVPPDFTCVHQTCPSSPSEESCFRIYNAGECCPSFECMLGDANQPLADGCPTPVCADSSCHIEIPPGHECPTCVCGESMPELEHNNLEQVQQISQNTEMEPMQQTFESIGNGGDYSEEELQMMPLRIQDSEGQSPILEKIILPEIESIDEYAEELRELEENSNEANSSVESAFNNVSEEVMLFQRENSTLVPDVKLNDTYLESLGNQSEKNVQKRSEASDTATVKQEVSTQWKVNEDIEREGIDLEGNDENFNDELESFKNKIFDKNGTIINEILTIDHTVKVPPGCPTPLCEGPWCKIGIPEGHECPTCICKRHIDSEP